MKKKKLTWVQLEVLTENLLVPAQLFDTGVALLWGVAIGSAGKALL